MNLNEADLTGLHCNILLCLKYTSFYTHTQTHIYVYCFVKVTDLVRRIKESKSV